MFSKSIEPIHSPPDLITSLLRSVICMKPSTSMVATSPVGNHPQRLVRVLITEIVADVDEKVGEIALVIHWKGGQHSELRLRKLQPGEHRCRTSEEAVAVMRSMAGRWSDEEIAASLNRMGMPTGQDKTWTAHRVSSLRRVRGIHAYRSSEKNGEWLTLQEAAAKFAVSHHQIGKVIKAGILQSVAGIAHR
jgi:hypothetical protein